MGFPLELGNARLCEGTLDELIHKFYGKMIKVISFQGCIASPSWGG